jgi:TfoX/Sxy family transcriptional regulator of competence genes
MDAMEQIIANLMGLGPISVRPVFGGHGIYWRDVIFGILFGGAIRDGRLSSDAQMRRSPSP